MARAVYKRPDILFMDDPISALDADVRKKVFTDVFVGLMKDKTRILVTHAVDFIHLADHIIIMKDGSVQAQGSYESLVTHPYIEQIRGIHQKNKNELRRQASSTTSFEFKTKIADEDEDFFFEENKKEMT